MKVWAFVTDVVSWVEDPMNRSVVDYHRSCLSTMTDKEFRAEISRFLEQRLYQSYGLRKSDMPRGFIGRAITMYAQDVL